jgi:hypothetical protein
MLGAGLMVSDLYLMVRSARTGSATPGWTLIAAFKAAFGKIKAAPNEIRALVNDVRAKEAAAKEVHYHHPVLNFQTLLRTPRPPKLLPLLIHKTTILLKGLAQANGSRLYLRS